MSKKRAVWIVLLLAAVAVVLVLGPGPGAVTAAPEDPALEDFVPTEELPADSAVAFPVDI